MKLEELYAVRDELIEEGVLDRVPPKYRKIVGGILAAVTLATAPAEVANPTILQNKAHSAAVEARKLDEPQFDELVSTMNKILPNVRDLTSNENRIKDASMVYDLENYSPDSLAHELETAGNSWTQHKVDGKELWLKPHIVKKAEHAIEFFVDKGMNRAAAIALVGGFIQESNLNEKATNPRSGAFGIAQWLGDRKKGAPKDFQGQLQYVWDELQGPERSTYRMLQRADSLGRLIYASNRYERFAGWRQGGRGDLEGTEHGHRTEYTKLLAQKFGGEDRLSQEIQTQTL